MKTLTKLLYVEVDEEVTDLVDRLRALQDEQAVTFVVPERARSLQSPMSFRLLKRYADAYGKHVNLISPDPRLQSLALESGFSAFPSLAAYDTGSEVHRPQPGAETAREESSAVAVAAPAADPVPARAAAVETRTAQVLSGAPRPRPAQAPPDGRGPRRPTDRRLFYLGGAALGLLALVAAMLFLPSADVRITVAGTPLKTDMQLIGMPNPVSGTIDHFPTTV